MNFAKAELAKGTLAKRIIFGVFCLINFAVAASAVAAGQPTITITNPDASPARSKTITATTSSGTLTMSNTSGSVCNGARAFVAYASQTFDFEYYNGTRVCYKAVDAGGTSYLLSDAISGIDIVPPGFSGMMPGSEPARSKTFIAETDSDGILTMSNTRGSVCDDSLVFVDYFSQTFSSESDNGISICFRYADIAGNEGFYFTDPIAGIDRTSPVIAGLGVDAVPAKTKTWVWESEPGALFRFVIDGNASSTLSGDYATTSTAVRSSGDGVYYFHIQAVDAVGNESGVVTVSAILDNTSPEITVSGVNPVIVTFGSTYTDGGAIATDNIDASVTVVSSGNVNAALVGDYVITYNAADVAGNAATPVSRVVHVVASDLTAAAAGSAHSIPGQYTASSKLMLVRENSDDQSRMAARIQYLISEIARLRKLLADMKSGGTGSNTKYSCLAITKNLFYGAIDNPQVRCLQEFLQSQGAGIYFEGKITGNFSNGTKAAVIRFQEKYPKEILFPYGFTQGNGVVGLKTRAVINRLITSDSAR